MRNRRRQWFVIVGKTTDKHPYALQPTQKKKVESDNTGKLEVSEGSYIRKEAEEVARRRFQYWSGFWNMEVVKKPLNRE